MTTIEAPNTPTPDGAIELGDWGVDPAGHRSRWVSWASFADGDLTIDGGQCTDGTIDGRPGISLWVDGSEQLTPAQARRLADALSATVTTGHRSDGRAVGQMKDERSETLEKSSAAACSPCPHRRS